MSDVERRSIEPDDWPLEEGSAEMQDGLRTDTGTSQSTPREDAVRAAGGAGAEPVTGAETATADTVDDTSDRGPLGTATPGSKGTEQGSR